MSEGIGDRAYPSGPTFTLQPFPSINIDHVTDTDATPRSRRRAGTLSQVASAFVPTSTPDSGEKSPTRTQLPTASNQRKPSKALSGQRKLIFHVLEDLEARPRPPDIWDSLSIDEKSISGERRLGQLAKSVKDAVTSRQNVTSSRSTAFRDADSDEEELPGDTYSTDETLTRLEKLKDVLLIAQSQGWHIFDDGVEIPTNNSRGSSYRAFGIRRTSTTPGSRSRSPSPVGRDAPNSSILTRCLDILNSIIQEDCRFRVTRARLIKPPFMLQLLTLNIARLLASFNWHRPDLMSRIGTVMIPAFYSFPPAMHTMLLEFFEGSLLRPILQELRHSQKLSPSQRKQDLFDETEKSPMRAGSQIPVAIQVDKAQDELYTLQNEATPTVFAKSLPTSAPAQSLDTYHLSSIITPFLCAVLDNVDFRTSDLARSYRLFSVLRLIFNLKPDSCLDVLDAVAYHTDRARYFAISIMMTYWPRSFGHTVISKPFPIMNYQETRKRVQARTMGNADPHFHEFVPWHFVPSPMSAVFEGASFEDCHACGKSIAGFGLLCPFCFCCVHSSCWDAPEGSCMAHYRVSGTSNKVALHRFSRLQLEASGFEPSTIRNSQGHAFVLVNLYTLSLCAICGLPLWGHVAQGYHCYRCKHFVHGECIRAGLQSPNGLPCQPSEDISRITIDSKSMHATFFNFYEDLIFAEEALSKLSYEEVTVGWSILSLQLQLLQDGVASGSVVITSDEQQRDFVDTCEMKRVVSMYESHLQSGKVAASALQNEVFHDKPHSPHSHMFMFNLPVLHFMASTLKSPPHDEQDIVPGLLNVQRTLDIPMEEAGDCVLYSVSCAQIRHVLSREFQIHHKELFRIVVHHLHTLGFLECHDLVGQYSTSTKDMPMNEAMCTFPIPLGLDNSANVESLIAAVESCLKSLDLSVNEAGFLMLSRKLWPNELASEYALFRLTRSILEWILSEDEALIVILRERVATKHNDLPGVPQGIEVTSWPRAGLPSGSASNGNDYVGYRRALRSRYACRWLCALHALDLEGYANMLYEICSTLALEEEAVSLHVDATADDKAKDLHSVSSADRTLRYIGKLYQTAVAFSAIDDLMIRWLNDTEDFSKWKKPLISLERLINREMEGSSRTTQHLDASWTSTEHVSGPLMDPWRIIDRVASIDLEGLRKALNWLCIFAASGVEIPVATFMQVSNYARDFNATFEDDTRLCEAILLSAWMKSLGRQDLQKVIVDVHWRNASTVLDGFGSLDEEVLLRYFRHTLGATLLLYGCERAYLINVGLLLNADVGFLPSWRKMARRAPMPADMMKDIDIVSTLADCIDVGTDRIRCYIARALITFLNETTTLNAREMDTFIANNCQYLTRCVWKLYEIHSTQLDGLRPALLSRILVVSSQPFEEIAEESFRSGNPWHIRLEAVARLFRIILDITSPAINVPEKPWRSSMILILYRFFSCIWAEEQEDIRVAADTWSKSLQASHLQAIAECFTESLSRSPIAERVRLVSFLLHLRSHFPTWRVLSWKIIVDTLMDDDFVQRNGDSDESPAIAHLSMYGFPSRNNISSTASSDPETAVLQSSLLLLSLQMIADGVQVDIFSLLRVKFHLAIALGFANASLVPAPSGYSFHVQLGEMQKYNDYALACIDGLLLLLDANRNFALPISAVTGAEDDSNVDVLIGSVMIDVFLGIFNDEGSMTKLPVLTQKVLLQSIAVIVLKHDMDRSPLNHLQNQLRRAIRKVTDMLPMDISYELRHLCLSVLQAFLKRWPSMAVPSLVNQVYNMIQLIHSLHVRTDNALVNQATIFLETILVQYSTTTSSVLYQLCKRGLDTEFFAVIRHVLTRSARSSIDIGSLRNVILEGALILMAENTSDPAQAHIHENVKKYVELVHHQAYGPEFMSSTGGHILQIFRKASGSEDRQHDFNPNPILSMATTILRHNKAHSRDFISYLEQYLQIALGRFEVQVQTLQDLLRVSSSLYKRAGLDQNPATAGRRHANAIVNLMFDSLSEVLRGKGRANPVTLVSLVEALLPNPCGSVDQEYLSSEQVASLGSDALFYLHALVSMEIHQDRELTTSLSVCVMTLQAIRNDTSFLGRQLNETIYEKSGRHTLSVRAWNILLSKAIQVRSKTTNRRLVMHLSDFSPNYHASLQRNTTITGCPSEINVTDINQAYVSIKLWLLLARSCVVDTNGQPESVVTVASEDNSNDERSAITVWNELWPPFERLLYVHETDVATAEVSPVASFIYTSVANVLLFVRQLRSVVAMEVSSHVATLRKVKSLAKGESLISRLSRTINSLSDPPPEISLDTLINQTMQELLAAEKLHAMEMRRETGRAVPERNRKDIRFAGS